MSPFPVCPFSIETYSRNLSNPQIPPYLPISLMPNPPEMLLFSFQSLIYFFIQQIFPVYAQVSSIVLDPRCTTVMGWGGVQYKKKVGRGQILWGLVAMESKEFGFFLKIMGK